MTTATVAPVVVGVDDSELSLAATRLAAREAATQDRPLRVVHAFNWGLLAGDVADGERRGPAERITALAAATAAQVESELTVTEAIVEGPTVASLLRESSLAALLVLGDGGLNRCTSVTIDATAMQIAARAGCSVLIARESPAPAGTVLGAVDGSTSSPRVLEVAFDTAARHRAHLSVVQARETAGTPTHARPEQVAKNRERDRAAAERLASLVAPWRRRYPSVTVAEQVIAGDPAGILVELSRGAELVVVGARGDLPERGGLGAISQRLLQHAPVPVTVVHHSHQLYVQE